MVVAAYIGAFLAAVFYGVATIFQAIAVDRLAKLPHKSGLAAVLRAGWLYGLGLLCDLLAFIVSALALHVLPLFLVESTIASSVAVTAVLAVVILKQKLAKGEVVAVIVLVAGLVALALSAEEGTARHVSSAVGWILLGVTIPLIVGAVGCTWKARGHASGIVLAVIAGTGFGLVGVGARLIAVHSGIGGWLSDPYLWVIIAQGGLAVVCYGYALDRLATTAVAALCFTIETVVPSAIGLIWLGDGVRGGLWWLAAAGFVATLGACLRLASRSEVDLTEGP